MNRRDRAVCINIPFFSFSLLLTSSSIYTM